MFANRFTAFVDACSLAGALKRDLLLSLAEAEFFRLRWSEKVLDETQAAVAKILAERGVLDAADRAKRVRGFMQAAFEEATVSNYEKFMSVGADLPDQGDVHVLAAALKTRAHVLVTDNLKHFPPNILEPLNIEALSTDRFLADTIALNPGKAVAAIRDMRAGYKKPEKTGQALLIDMEAAGLIETVDVLRPHVLSL